MHLTQNFDSTDNRTLSVLNIWKIVLIGISLRLAWSLLVPVAPISDSHAYVTFAINIWQHGTYGWTPDSPTSYWPVGTSALYAAVFKIFGHSYSAIVGLNILLSVGIIVYAYKTVGLFFTRQTALLSALIVAIWPTLILFSTVLASELPYMFFTLAGIYYFFAETRVRLLNILIVGTSFVLAYYIRPLAIIVLAVCAFSSVVLLKRSLSNTAAKFLFICLIMLCAVAPWAKRNYDLYGHLVPMSTNGGVVFWMGNTPGTDGGYHELPDYVNGLNEYERSAILKAEALNYIRESPMAFITRTLTKFLKFHSHETIGATWNAEGITQSIGSGWILPLKVLTQAFWLLSLLGGIIGVFLHLRRGPIVQVFHPFILLWLSSAGIHSLIVAQDRYHIPIIPFVAAFCAYFIIQIATHKPWRLNQRSPNEQPEVRD